MLRGLELELNDLLVEERRIDARLSSAPYSGSSLRIRLKAVYFWTVTALLTAAGFALALVTLAPFRLGHVALVVAAGVAMVTPVLVERVLEDSNVLVKLLTFVAAPAAVACLMLFADVRGNVLDEQLRANQEQEVVFDDANSGMAPASDFYERSNRSFHVALLLLAFTMEIGAGLTLREAWLYVPDTSEDWNSLRSELAAIRRRKVQIVRAAVGLRNQPGIFAARFWRDFYRAMLSKAVRNALTKLVMIGFGLVLLGIQPASAANRTSLVVAIDLTRSVAVTGPDTKSEFQKNVEGVTRVLSQVHAGSLVTVIAITDHSFAQPYILLRAQVPSDPGYFGERLAAARRQMVLAWKSRAAKLNPYFPNTDILGSLRLANQIFDQQPVADHRTLVIFSDMRQSTPELDLEAREIAPPFTAVAKRCGMLPRLQNVQGYVLGVDGAGKTSAYWQDLQRFWQDCFHNTGVVIRSYSVLREFSQATESVDH